MSAPSASRRRLFIFLLPMGLICAALLAWAVFASVSPAAASFFETVSLPSPTAAVRFLPADIPKPAAAPTPTLPAPPATLSSPTPSLAFSVPPYASQTLPLEMSIIQTTAVVEMSIVEEAGLSHSISAAEPSSYAADKYILVDISEQHMYVYENGQLLYSFIASTGMNNATRSGLFHVQSKIPNAYGATWNIWMPYWLGIYWAGGLENGIHALPILPSGATLWEGYLGRPVSYGCVVLGSYEASLLYNWAEIGTSVEIRW